MRAPFRSSHTVPGTETLPWPRGTHLRRCLVIQIFLGGALNHLLLVLKEIPAVLSPCEGSPDELSFLVACRVF